MLRIGDEKVFALLFLGLLITSALFAFTYSSYFNIMDIKVSGNQYFSGDEIVIMSGIGENTNVFKVPLREIEARLRKNPRIESVQAKRKLPGTVIIEISERKAVALLPYSGYFVELSEAGVALSVVETLRNSLLPLITGARPVSVSVGEKVDLKKVLVGVRIASLFSEKLRPRLSEINVSYPQNVIVYAEDGIKILFGDWTSLENKVEVAEAILARVEQEGRRIGSIDLRIEKRPVVRLRIQ